MLFQLFDWLLHIRKKYCLEWLHSWKLYSVFVWNWHFSFCYCSSMLSRVFQKIDFSLICKCKQILSVYIPYEVNKKRIGNKSLKLMKCTKLFNIQRKYEKRRGKITPFSIFHFKENLRLFWWFCVGRSIPDIKMLP